MKEIEEKDTVMNMEAILRRDQRTTYHRVFDRFSKGRSNIYSITMSVMSSMTAPIGNLTSSFAATTMTISGTAAARTSGNCINTNMNANITKTAVVGKYCNSDSCDTNPIAKHKTSSKQIIDNRNVISPNTSRIKNRIDDGCVTNNHRESWDCKSYDKRQRHNCERSYPVTSRNDKRRARCVFAGNTWLRLSSLLLLLLVVSVNGAPTMTLEARRLSSPPKWVNPCGLAAEDFDGDLDVVQLQDEQLLNQVVVQAKTALMHAQLFKDQYIKHTFNTDYKDLHNSWRTIHYDWLPGPKDIPKELGEPLDQEFLEKLELDTALLNAYEYMQRYAVGLEQVVWDQEDYGLEFHKQFKETEFKLRTVLCELQVALVERGVTPRADITREAMTSQYRAMSTSATYRDLRDWMIFRDYMNGLEFVVQVFEHLRRRLGS